MKNNIKIISYITGSIILFMFVLKLSCHKFLNDVKFYVSNENENKKLNFGDICGVAPGGIPAYSCNYDTINPSKLTKYDKNFFTHQHNGIYYGIKYQCVEFIRRWLILIHGLTFKNVENACDIFYLSYAIKITDNKHVYWNNILNGSSFKPVFGSILVWQKFGKFKNTGHVAIVTEVSNDWIRIAEQNVHNTKWINGHNYSRELKVNYDKISGNYFIYDDSHMNKEKILGWKNLPSEYI